jgi:hypothetical protein
MHPDVRANGPGVCPRCAMALVPIPPPSFDRYPVDFTLKPAAVVPGRPAALRLRISGPRGSAPVTQLEIVHEMPLHLFIVGQDLDYFAHVHPLLQSSGTFTLPLTLPRPGVYHLFADFLPRGGTPQVAHHVVVTVGYAGDLAAHAQIAPLPRTQVQDGMQVELETPPLVPGRRALITCHVTDPGSGRPITDLEPYLGARGHLLVVSDDLTQYVHSHPAADDPERNASDIVFDVLFPQPGDYKLWAQLQRRSRVSTISFTVRVSR